MNMKYIFINSLLFLAFISSTTAQEQGQRFKAGFVFGLNAAQLDGDDLAGFNKLGLQGGLRAEAKLKEKTRLSFEILFSQRGSRSEIIANRFVEPRKLHLDYIEVPVIFNYLDWLSEDGFYKFHFHIGAAYSRLLNTKTDDDSFDELVNEFNKNNIGLLAGATFYINEKFGLTVRYNRSVTLLFNNNKSTSVNAKSLLGYFLSFQGVYMF
ncbi:MAG TPA: PorT family protein [Bacteroidetes bacterium]|nr:PorT family protein [Bacteroidota bacterium]